MKLNELGASRPTEQATKVLENQTGRKLDFSVIGPRRAAGMLRSVRGLLSEHRSRPEFHASERDSGYLRLLMLEQALKDHISEMDAGGVVAVDLKDPKTQATLKKAQSGQNLSPEEQKVITAVASMKKESLGAKRMVSESEIQQAQVVLAAQDMIDRLQGMMEDISEMQFKDLPALANSIKNDMGTEQATQFQSAASQALTTLLQAVQAGKTEMESAQGVITGQAPVVPGDTAGATDPSAPMGEPAADDELDLDADLSLDANLDDEIPDETLGRERR